MATKDTNYLVAVHKGLDESLEKQVAALPEKFNKQRFLQNCMTVLQDGQADFSKCEAPTVVRTLLKGAFLGLDFFNGECYAIPYGNQCQFQTDYKGEIKLCKRYSSNPIQDIYAKVVREGDEFEEVIENGKQYVNFSRHSSRATKRVAEPQMRLRDLLKPKAADAILRRNTLLRTKRPRSSSILHGLRNTSYSRILQNMSQRVITV